jgi:UDP-2,4-diacetamido-2,4,6-trideoxy-beta-L-altropyranose hydrolase
MKIAVRADATVAAGMGHMMRCLTLADEMRNTGANVRFVCRDAPDALLSLISQHGHLCTMIPGTVHSETLRWSNRQNVDHATYQWEFDATATAAALRADGVVDWIVVDHYGLDARWESRLRPNTSRLLVIDDLANRPHACDVLLDQNLSNPVQSHYPSLVPPGSLCLVGTEFALVRPEFCSLRERALLRRTGDLQRVLVFMGGSDPANETKKALLGLLSAQKTEIAVDVVIGASNPHGDEVRAVCDRLRGASLHVQTPHMAELMSSADCSIGAGGGATWERCVLGLPALTAILAENQRHNATALSAAGAQRTLGWYADLTPRDYARAILSLDRHQLQSMSRHAAEICDGEGARRVAEVLMAPPAVERVRA